MAATVEQSPEIIPALRPQLPRQALHRLLLNHALPTEEFMPRPRGVNLREIQRQKKLYAALDHIELPYRDRSNPPAMFKARVQEPVDGKV